MIKAWPPASKHRLYSATRRAGFGVEFPLKMTVDANAIVIQNIGMVFGAGVSAVMALEGINLEIGSNEFFTLLGPSGCGKTTLLRLIAGFEQPSTGSISLYGQHLEGLMPFERPVNTVFQSYALFPHMSVAQNIAFGLEMQRKPKLEIQKTVSDMLELVRLTGFEARKPAQLSGGQQQRVALARALANRPKVLLLDESLSALDAKLRKEMQLELKRLQLETGITFVFVTHDQEEALTMSDRIAVMKNGKLEQIGTPTEIYDFPRSRYVADFIGETNFLTGIAEANGLRLPDTQLLEVSHSRPLGSSVDVAVRPERAQIAREGNGLNAVVREVVYVGTDTVVYLEIASEVFRVRMQNHGGAAKIVSVGENIKLVIPPDAVRILEAES
jgi:spermidine/putrescine transport system ATP-binding protein